MSGINPSIEPRVAVLQDAARLHYVVPLALQRAGALERVFTDWYTRSGSLESAITAVLKVVSPVRAKRLGGRFIPELDVTKVRSKPTLIFSQFLGRRHFKNEIEYFAWMSDLVAQWVLDQGFGNSNAFFGFVRNVFPGLCSTVRHQGLKVITDQIIAPYVVEHAEALKQRERFPGWGNTSSRNDRTLSDFERGTWESSDLVTCPSDYVREGLINCGVDAKKIVVLPYPADATQIKPADRNGRTGPVTVGYIGHVGLRKGAPYFFQVAKKVDPAKAKFVMVGPIGIDPAIAEQYRGEVQLTGPVSRAETLNWLGKFDILLFPSTCEGSASGVTEAMLAGLPVVASPNSGSLIRHGVDGFIAGYEETDRMADYVMRLATDVDLRAQIGAAARQRAEGFGVDLYGQRLKELFSGLLQQPDTNAARRVPS